MAIGGALRAAIRAGKFGVAARESRQKARALRTLNRTGGVGNFPQRVPLDERGFERMSGFAYGATPRGNALVVSPSGARTVMPQSLDDYMMATPLPRSPIEAPYEGFRVFNGVEESVPPWIGRGRAPAVDQPWLNDYGFYDAYRPYNQMDPEMMGYTGYMNVPAAFGGAGPYGDPMTAFTRSYRRPTRYSFDDITGGFVDRGPSIQF